MFIFDCFAGFAVGLFFQNIIIPAKPGKEGAGVHFPDMPVVATNITPLRGYFQFKIFVKYKIINDSDKQHNFGLIVEPRILSIVRMFDCSHTRNSQTSLCLLRFTRRISENL
jgi:hypothetical protein